MIRPRPAQIDRVALVVESDEALNPVDVGVLGPEGFSPSIERTSSSGLRPLPAAAHVKRWASPECAHAPPRRNGIES
jgi:hypothetical protein